MTKMQPHEELMEAGMLDEFKDTMGKAMFVSHQWLGRPVGLG